VIGVARDTSADIDRDGPVRSALYLPVSADAAGSALIVRVRGEPEAARRSIDGSLAAAAPGAVREIHRMQELVAGRLYPFRVAYWMAGAVGVLALLLTVSGVYGVLSYLVTQRAREIGLRMALGARVVDLVALVVRRSLRLAAIGLLAGGLLALGAVHLVAARLLMIDTSDGAAFLVGMLAVVAACVLGSAIPAIRAVRVDPMTTLRAA
jgi:putative ABC transport system permease protein